MNLTWVVTVLRALAGAGYDVASIPASGDELVRLLREGRGRPA